MHIVLHLFLSKMILLCFKAFIGLGNFIKLPSLTCLPLRHLYCPYTGNLKDSNFQVPAVGLLECNHLPRRFLTDSSRSPGTQLGLQRTSASLELISVSVLWDTECCLTLPSELNLSQSKSGRSPFRVRPNYN